MKILYKELNIVKQDIYNNTTLSDSKYHQWLKDYRYKIIPETFEESYPYDLKKNPQKYLKHMIFMVKELEKIEAKTFQIFPLQTSCIPKHVVIDTVSIIDLFDTGNKNEMKKNIEPFKKNLWERYFNITQKINGYVFKHAIITDGFSCSIRFLNQDNEEEERLKTEAKSNGKKALKGLSKEEKASKKETKKLLDKQKAKEARVAKKNQNAEVSKEKKKKQDEFQYIDEVPKENLKGKHIFIDPGKNTLLHMMDSDGKFLRYTNKQRVKATKRLEYQATMKKFRDDTEITEKEEPLSGFNSKTVCPIKFKEYIVEKLRINEEVYLKYQEEKIRRYKWYSYINKKREEDRMLNLIQKKFGKDIKIIIGDWSIGKQMKNFISTPNLAIKRKLKERFDVYNIDEYKTSCINNITKEKNKNLYLPDSLGKTRKIHSILTYKMENRRLGCINRDRNACFNIKEIFDEYLRSGKRPEIFQRTKQQDVLTSQSETEMSSSATA